MEKIYAKIKNIDELSEITEELKARQKKVVHCHGIFDIVHPGHIRHLASAKKEGDILVVTVTADKYVKRGPGRPIFNENLRAETLASLAKVDFVGIDYNPTAINIIKAIKPDVYVKGPDYIDKSKDVTGMITEEEEAVVSVGGKLVFTQDITFSSSKLINEHLQVFPEKTRQYLKHIASKYSLDTIFQTIESLKTLKVLVIGEAIIDQYHYCEGMDKSRKSNVIANKYVSEETFAGGALAIANHLAGVVDEVSLITLTGGERRFTDFIDKSMKPNVKMINFIRENTPTLTKRRFVSGNQKLFEICYLDDTPLSLELEEKINSKLDKIIQDYDLVVVADFGHGLLTKNLIRTICEKAKFLAVNTQTNGANMGFNFITQYSHINYAALDELELRYAAHDKTGELSEIMKKISRRIGCRNLIVTKGYQGALSLIEDSEGISAPALASKVIDPVGAGDAFFAFTAPLVAKKAPLDLVLFVGNAVGALAVQIVCNRAPVDPVYLKKFIITVLK
jgi:rfaE bifunctional protein kinase chain/domain/rfaE bifunctional protein nucleotidyltransferase chain/domain